MKPSALARTAARPAIGFWRGLTYPFRGAGVVYAKHPDLIVLWGPPILLLIACIALGGFSAFAVQDELVAWVWPPPTDAGFLGDLARFFHALLGWLVGVLLVVVVVLVAAASTSVIAAPFNDLLSEKIEERERGTPGVPFSFRTLVRDTVRSVIAELAKLFLWLMVMTPVFVLSLFVPGVGHLVSSVLGFVFTSVYFAYDYVDWPQARRNRGLGARVAFLRRHFFTLLGFGTGVWVFLFVPLVNLLFMPAAVAGGTLLFLDLEAEADAVAPKNV